EHVALIAPASRALSARERRILFLRFFEELSQQEIARELGVTQMQVSRLLAKTLGKLRAAIEQGADPRGIKARGAAASPAPAPRSRAACRSRSASIVGAPRRRVRGRARSAP